MLPSFRPHRFHLTLQPMQLTHSISFRFLYRPDHDGTLISTGEMNWKPNAGSTDEWMGPAPDDEIQWLVDATELAAIILTARWS